MEAPQGERALHPRYLVVVKLHRIDRAAAKLVVLCVGAEYGESRTRARVPFGCLGGLCWRESEKQLLLA